MKHSQWTADPLIRWKRVCEEAGPGKAEDPENREKRVKTRPLTSSPPLVFRGPLETSRRSELLVNVYLFL